MQSGVDPGRPETSKHHFQERSYFWNALRLDFWTIRGLMSFELISYHLSSAGTVTQHWIPLFLSISTAMGVVASLILGRTI
jgi:hypothetical protein